jgi:D-alanine--poly(phosphoribitol) ligase subunit 1
MTGATGQPASVLVGAVRPLDAHSIVDLIHRQSTLRPDAPALLHGARRWTFAELRRWSTGIAATLADAGVGPGDRVLLWADRTPATVAAALALMTLRAAYVPVDPAFPAQRMQAVVDGSAPVLLLHDSEAATIAPPAVDVPVLDLAELSEPAVAPSRARTAPDARDLPHPDDPAYVIFTSGSTGAPKGVVIEHGSLANYVQWCAHTTGLAAGGGSPLFGSLGFDHAITSLWPALAHGSPVTIFAGVWDQQALFDDRPTPFELLKVTPSHLRFFERTSRPDYRRTTRLLMFGGEALDPALIAGLGERLDGVRLMNHYGPTEATIGCCYNEFDPVAVQGLPSVPIGRPIWNTRAYLVDDQLRPARPGEAAELVIAGAGVAAGYLGRAEAAGVFLDEADLGGPAGRAYRTGDRVELLPDGTLLYLGRDDSQFKISGYRIELGELRRHTLSVPGVLDVAFGVVPGAVESMEALLVLTPEPDASADREASTARAVRAALTKALPAALVPRRIKAVPELLLNANGKCDLAATRAAALTTAD